LRIIFIGAVEFSRHCLEAILKANGDVVAVFTVAKEQAGIHADYSDLSWAATNYGIPVHKVKNLESNVELIRSLRPDVIFVFGWSRIISQSILNIPPLGCVGSHPALLPKNRGRHPIIWTLVEGLEESGLTFFYLENTADSGDILWQQEFPVSLEDDARTLYDRISFLAREAISEFLPQLEQSTAPRVPQNSTQATNWRKRTQKDGEINWATTSMVVFNLVRGLTRPYLGAHTCLDGDEIKVWRTSLPLEPTTIIPNGESPGTVLSTHEHGFLVRTGDSYITIGWDEIEGDAWIKAGMKLGS
jgi:methionyl-tRNA formyltransferase